MLQNDHLSQWDRESFFHPSTHLAQHARGETPSRVIRTAKGVWIEDRDFDITYHVRVSALPQPGSDDQLHDLVARLNSRPLDRERPLWEVYLIEGVADDQVRGQERLRFGHGDLLKS